MTYATPITVKFTDTDNTAINVKFTSDGGDIKVKFKTSYRKNRAKHYLGSGYLGDRMSNNVL